MEFAAARAGAAGYDPAAWEAAVCKAYGSAAEGVIALEHEAQKNEPSARLRRIDAMEKHWEEILELLAGLPSSQEIVALLRSLDSPCLPSEIGVDNNLLRQTFLYCKEVRARYTILQMAWDLGLLDTLSDRVIGEL